MYLRLTLMQVMISLPCSLDAVIPIQAQLRSLHSMRTIKCWWQLPGSHTEITSTEQLDLGQQYLTVTLSCPVAKVQAAQCPLI